MAHLRGRSGSSGAPGCLRLLTGLGGSLTAFRGPTGLCPRWAGLLRPPTRRCPLLFLPSLLLKATLVPAEVARQHLPLAAHTVGGDIAWGRSPGRCPVGGARRGAQAPRKTSASPPQNSRPAPAAPAGTGGEEKPRWHPRKPCAPAGLYGAVAIVMITTETSDGLIGGSGGQRGGGRLCRPGRRRTRRCLRVRGATAPAMPAGWHPRSARAALKMQL